MDPTTAVPAPPGGKPGLLINRNFALLWSGGAISYIGDFVFSTTLLLWIAYVIGKGQSWAPLAVSGVLVAASLPVLLVGPVAGVFVDRWDKRRTMLAMDAARAVLIALLLLAANRVPLPFLPGGRLSAFEQIGAIYAVIFLASICAQFFNPARLALIGDIVKEPERARAAGLMQTVMALGIVVGPALAAPLFFGVGVAWALLANALSFVASFLAILAVRAPRSARSVAVGEQGSVWRELTAGARFFAGNRVLMTLLVTIAITWSGGGALNALDVFFVTTNLHAAPSLYGNLEATYGLGAVLGALAASFVGQRLGVARTLWLSILALGMLVVVYSRLTSYAPALVVLFLTGVTNAAEIASVGPLLLHVTPRELIGRVSAIINPVGQLVGLISTALAGYLVSTVLQGFHATVLGIVFGPIDTIFAVAGLLGILAALYAARNLRGVRLAGERAPAP